MKESDFQKEIKCNFKRHNAWVKKFDDQPNGKRCKQPFDLIGCYQGQCFAIECKQKKDYGSFSKSDLNGDQEKELTEFEEFGKGKAYIFLDIRLLKDYSRIYIFRWKELKKIFETGSIKKTELLKMAYLEGVNGVINFSKFLKEIKEQ